MKWMDFSTFSGSCVMQHSNFPIKQWNRSDVYDKSWVLFGTYSQTVGGCIIKFVKYICITKYRFFNHPEEHYADIRSSWTGRACTCARVRPICRPVFIQIVPLKKHNITFSISRTTYISQSRKRRKLCGMDFVFYCWSFFRVFFWVGCQTNPKFKL